MKEQKEIMTALLKAQREMSNPKKGSSNPYFKSKYADLNAVREAIIPVLNKYDILVLQPLVAIEGRNYVKTLLVHATSGEQIEGLTEILSEEKNSPQKMGSGITYARRYGLQSLVCIGADDDDGNEASEKPKEKEQKKKEQKKVTPPSEEFYNAMGRAIEEIKEAKTRDDLIAIYNKYKSLQKHETFTLTLTNKQDEIDKQ